MSNATQHKKKTNEQTKQGKKHNKNSNSNSTRPLNIELV